MRVQFTNSTGKTFYLEKVGKKYRWTENKSPAALSSVPEGCVMIPGPEDRPLLVSEHIRRKELSGNEIRRLAVVQLPGKSWLPPEEEDEIDETELPGEVWLPLKEDEVYEAELPGNRWLPPEEDEEDEAEGAYLDSELPGEGWLPDEED